MDNLSISIPPMQKKHCNRKGFYSIQSKLNPEFLLYHPWIAELKTYPFQSKFLNLAWFKLVVFRKIKTKTLA